MIKYEYNAINNPQFLGDRLLNRLGENGWELVSHAYNSNTCDHFYTFKRVKIEEEPGWVDPMMEMLDREEKESEWQRRRRLEVMKEASMNPNPANYESRDITVEDIHKIHRENQEERELIKKILSDPRNADGFADEEHKQPRYVYEGYTYILNLDLNRIMGVEVPTYAVERKWLMDDLKEAVVSDTPVSSWMEDYKEAYDHLRNSGMFWEFHPTWTGKWEEDKYAFCHDRKFKKK